MSSALQEHLELGAILDDAIEPDSIPYCPSPVPSYSDDEPLYEPSSWDFEPSQAPEPPSEDEPTYWDRWYTNLWTRNLPVIDGEYESDPIVIDSDDELEPEINNEINNELNDSDNESFVPFDDNEEEPWDEPLSDAELFNLQNRDRLDPTQNPMFIVYNTMRHAPSLPDPIEYDIADIDNAFCVSD